MRRDAAVVKVKMSVGYSSLWTDIWEGAHAINLWAWRITQSSLLTYKNIEKCWHCASSTDSCLCIYGKEVSSIFSESILSSSLLPGITLPSAFSAIYFLLFVGVCTWWACHFPISHLGFNALCVMVGFFTSGHMVCLYLYQSLLAQAVFPPHSLWAR